MRRRSRAGGEPAKAHRRKTGARKSHITPKALHPRSSSAARAETKVARLTRERDEALQRQTAIANENTRLLAELRESLQQQTATADVLKVINRSTFDLQTVLDTLVESAASLCVADKSAIWQRDGEFLRLWATNAVTPEAVQYATEHPLQVGHNSATGRAALEGKAVHILDVLADAEYGATGLREAVGYRTALGVPLLRTGAVIGVFALTRQEVSPFSEKQIELVTTFADQAVIAIENARLLSELRESLQQQTATADVLKVISRSAFDLQAVLDTLVESAARLSEAETSFLFRRQGANFRWAAGYGHSPEYLEQWKDRVVPPDRGTAVGRAAADGKIVHILDVFEDSEYSSWESQRAGGYRSVLGVPLLREGVPIGVLGLTRSNPQSFTDKQIELLTTFADQAVIAIENVRLFDEVQKRTSDLTEALEQQTATGEILSAISGSMADTKPVFDVILRNLLRLFGTRFAAILLLQDGRIHLPAVSGEPGFERLTDHYPRPFDQTSIGGQAMILKETIQIAPVVDNPAVLPFGQQMARDFGYNSLIVTPMIRGDDVIGALATAYREPKPFTDKQVALLQNFAAQAVIAIENARLLTELHQRTDELAQRQAELSVTFDNMGDGVVMFNEELRLAAWNRNLQEILDLPDSFFAEPRTYRDYMVYLIEHGEFGDVDLESELRRYIESADRQRRVERTRPDGRVLEVRVNPVPGGGFVAIYSDVTERKKAEERVRAARDAAESALRELKAAQDRLVQTEKLASLGQLTAGIAHEIKNPLNFVNNFSAVSVELIDELREELGAFTSTTNGAPRSTRSPIRCKAISTRSCSMASVPTRSSRTCCCIPDRALESTDQWISMLSWRKASISPITVRGPRSRASISPSKDPLTRPLARLICSRRRLRGRCST
jgi:two-component system, NtrC family, sensor kinase